MQDQMSTSMVGMIPVPVMFQSPAGAPTYVPGLGMVPPNTVIQYQASPMMPPWIQPPPPTSAPLSVRVGVNPSTTPTLSNSKNSQNGAPSRGRGRGRGNHIERAPTTQELQTARKLRGAPVMMSSGSRSTAGSSSGHSVNAVGGALMQIGAKLSEAPPSVSTSTVASAHDPAISNQLSISTIATSTTLSTQADPNVDNLNSTAETSTSKSSFRVVRRKQLPATAQDEAKGDAPKATVEEATQLLRASIATSTAEMFVPAAGMLAIKKAFSKDAVAHTNALKSNSVGEVVDILVCVLSDHRSRPEGFGEAQPTEEDMPMVSLFRFAALVEAFCATHEHFKRHFTRTMLNLVADATTERNLRMCAAALLGLLFKLNFYGDNDPYQTLVDVLQPFGQIANPDTSIAIVRLLAVSECKPTPATRVLHDIFRNTEAPKAAPVGGSSLNELKNSRVQPNAPPPPYSTSVGSGSENDTPYEVAKRKTVYITRIDPSMSEGELRNVLLEGGDFNKVRLCGDTPGRCKYCFVEYVNEAAAHKMVRNDGRWFGNQQMRISMAKAPIETNDPRDALFDANRGKVRACVFGLSLRSSELAASGKPLSNSAPTTAAEKSNFHAERRKRTDKLIGEHETGVMDRVTAVSEEHP